MAVWSSQHHTFITSTDYISAMLDVNRLLLELERNLEHAKLSLKRAIQNAPALERQLTIEQKSKAF